MAPDGSVFELTQIVPFIRRQGLHPVTGEPLAARDLVPLHFARNAEGEFCCPVTGRLFTVHSRIAAIRTTGNVYAWEALQTLCLGPRMYRDLLTDAPFAGRADVVLLQDPGDAAVLARRNVNAFQHVRAAAAAGAAAGAARTAAGAGLGGSLTSASGTTIRVSNTALEALDELRARERDGSLPTISGAKRRRPDDAEGQYAAPGDAPASVPATEAAHHVTGYGVATSAALAASLTSTGMTLATRNAPAADTRAAALARRWSRVAALGRKAYVRIETSAGDLNVELHADLAPRTVDNFISLSRSSYYDGTIFHRLIRNFMVQGGDPSGTGTGGTSAWGAPFADEFHSALSHSTRGVLSMANTGKDSNRSQFFITLRSAPHLDRKHTVFGRVVGGLDTTLRAIENVPTGVGDRPLRDITLRAVHIIQDPFEGDSDSGVGSISASGGAVSGAGASIAARVAAGTAASALPGRVVSAVDAAAAAAARAARAAAPKFLAPATAVDSASAPPVGHYLQASAEAKASHARPAIVLPPPKTAN